MTEWLTDWLSDWLTVSECLTVCLNVWLTQLACLLTDWLTDGRTDGRTDKRTDGRTDGLAGWLTHSLTHSLTYLITYITCLHTYSSLFCSKHLYSSTPILVLWSHLMRLCGGRWAFESSESVSIMVDSSPIGTLIGWAGRLPQAYHPLFVWWTVL